MVVMVVSTFLAALVGMTWIIGCANVPTSCVILITMEKALSLMDGLHVCFFVRNCD